MWVPSLALISDFVDGKLARATGTVSSFGQYADFLSDTALWTWFSLRHEPRRTVQLAALTAWLAPVIVVLAGSFMGGRMIEVPRRWWFRPAATVQVLLGARMALRWLRSRPLSDGQSPWPGRRFSLRRWFPSSGESSVGMCLPSTSTRSEPGISST
ncbi:CDP-alcohol phosphatidyltransferase family protein [Arthrobacter sp. CAN_A2]|uniref:CDP-alcohol phosphatidyltransferase family protein n=1 Tax=Arthrobacter sp. CAN_A2 TaxID=2787718 RepID=UPI003FA47392